MKSLSFKNVLSHNIKKTVLGASLAIIAAFPAEMHAQKKKKDATTKPNIVVIMGDDIGWFNTSIYNSGMMGYKTPHIDRIGHEGARFTDWYGQQSCTAGRAAFITGQSPIRTGLTKVGLPGSELGLQKEDPTIAEYLKHLGYTNGQFGKNHLGDKDEHLPTAHGFDEFFGNLYHLNAEEEPENEDYPKNPEFKAKYGPRGVIHSFANGKITDTGSLTKKRMETIDDESLNHALRFMDDNAKAEKPFFLYFNSTRMHLYTHLKPESKGKTGLGVYPDGMVEHDGHVGDILNKIDELGIAENTIIIYTTDNGAEIMTWPDGGATPFRGEKNTTWEGGFRVPTLIKWPGIIKPNTVYNDMMAHEDLLPTLVAAAGDADVVEKTKKGYTMNGKNYKVHLDGYNMLPFFKGEMTKSPRENFLYWTDEGDLAALRLQNWKVTFKEQHNHGMDVWIHQYTDLRMPGLYNLKTDPFERADESILYNDWKVRRMYVMVPARDIISNWLSTFKEFPVRQKTESWNLDGVMQKLMNPAPSNN